MFTFDASWNGFARTAVFECAGERREQLLVNDRCIVPWEILHAGAYLRVGVYGVDGNKTMPTVYSGQMFVARGAEPSEAAREHSADIFDQIVEIGNKAAEAKEQWENMSAEAETLPAGTPATASYEGGVLSLGIPAGAQGPQGPKGDTGETGATGPQGPQGEQGVQGPAGADGSDGADGITPTIGTNGNWYLGDTDTGKPSRGVQGPQGEQGQQGSQGIQGPQGIKGDTGATGAQGPKGDKGDTGDTGAAGKSAYESAVDGGYTGTETQFNRDLSGLNEKLSTTGDGSNVTAAFTTATTRANIATGEKLSVIFGKIAKWFADLKTVAFTGSYNDLSDKPTIPSSANDISYTYGTGYSPRTIGKGLESLTLNLESLSTTVSDKLSTSGDGSNVTSAFTQASSRANITTGEKLSVIFGKISKWFADLKAVAFTGSYNDLTNKPTIPTVPTNVSAFTNDAGYLTSHQSLAAYRTAAAQDTIDATKETKGKITIGGVEKTADTHTVTIVTNGVTTNITLVGVQ